MGYSLQFNDLKKFLNSVDKMADDFNGFLRKLLLQEANKIIGLTKDLTPTITGDLRRSWILGDVKGIGTNVQVEILNGMEYATDVEYGHRLVRNGVELKWVDGRFMLTISIDKIRKQLPYRYEKDFNLFCRKEGIEP